MEKIFDSHAHYDDEKFDCDREEILEKIRESGVDAVINVGCDLDSSKRSIELCQRRENFFCSVGFHPHSASEADEGSLEEIRQFTKEKKVVAIGEIGLDYHYDFSPRAVQREVFEKQLILAGELELPVIVHDREAHEETLELLAKYRPKGVVHCFSGSAETAGQILRLGMYLGFTGVVTFENAKKVLRAVEQTPLDRILLETDCPYMAPVPHRGKRNDSSLIPYTAEKIAQIKGVSADEVIRAAYENTCRLFQITPGR